MSLSDKKEIVNIPLKPTPKMSKIRMHIFHEENVREAVKELRKELDVFFGKQSGCKETLVKIFGKELCE